MRRKIVQQGAATLMVSLPSQWAKLNNLKKGNEVEVEEKGNQLHIFSTAVPEKKTVAVELNKFGPYLSRFLEAFYKSGYDEIKVTFQNPESLNEIQNCLGKEMSGLEIFDQSRNFCVLQDIEGVDRDKFDPALKRVFYLLLQMAEESLQVIKSQKYEELKPLRFLEESNNRFTAICIRSLSKLGYKKPERMHFMYFIVEKLEQVADQYKYLFDFLMQNKNLKISKQMLDLYENLSKMLRLYHELFYKFENEKAKIIDKMRTDIIQTSNKNYKSFSKEELMMIHYVMTICQMIFEMVEPTVALNF
ncbi:AbrB/MazE/SpoVT family DNA-binding domain-containing protein [Candidatus Woesearchaeota archaeon]|nr:AbrB/MazE/SpoVT family DNA-binding domain-containing protein [Candidatus Woesearchaeota archaeon]